MAYPFARNLFVPVLQFFIRSAKGVENVPEHGPCILACKHTGPLDGVFMAAVIVPKIKQKIHFITNPARCGWLWEKIVVQRWAGAIPYNKKDPARCLDLAQDYLRKGKFVGIFPGGLLQNPEATQRRGKTGVARLALWTRAPVLPIGLHNFKVLKRGKMIITHLRNPHNMRITIGKPMTFSDAYNKPITYGLLREITARIVDRIEQLSAM